VKEVVDEEVSKGKRLVGGTSLQERITLVRQTLRLQQDDTTAALFDALGSSEPFPGTKLLLDMKVDPRESATAQAGVITIDERKHLTTEFRRDYVVSNCKGSDTVELVNSNPEPNIAELSDEARKVLSEQNQQAFEKEAKVEQARGYNEAYMFLYNRMTLEARMKTSVHTRLRVEVTEYDGEPFVVEFESGRIDGVVAHAAYTKVRKKVEEFDLLARKFVRCLFELYNADRTTASVARDVAGNAWLFVAEKIYGKYALRRQRQPNRDGAQRSNAFDVIKFHTVDWMQSWAQRWSAGSPFKFDACKLEERVAELRLMVRELIPIWPSPDIDYLSDRFYDPNVEPPTPAAEDEPAVVASSASATVDLTDVPAAPGLAQPAPVAAPEDGDGILPALLDEEFETLNTDPERARKGQEALRKRGTTQVQEEDKPRLERERIRLKALKEEQIRKDNIEAERERNRILAIEADSSLKLIKKDTDYLLLVRRLPHIVEPVSFAQFSFKVPENFFPTDTLLPSNDEAKRFGYWFASRVVGYLAGQYVFLLLSKRAEGLRQFFVQEQQGYGLFNIVASAVNLASGGDGTMSPDAANALGSIFGGVINTAIPDWAIEFAVLPFAHNIASSVVSMADNRLIKLPNAKQKAYNEFTRKLRGNPFSAAVSSASNAMKMYNERITDVQSELSKSDKVAVVFNFDTNTRFMFYEYYLGDAAVLELTSKLPALKTSQDWASVPDGNALRLLPPRQVAESLFEAEQLRGMPMTQTTNFTAGLVPSLAARTPAGVSAEAAHIEIMQVVVRARRELKGQHIMQSSGQLGLQLAQSGGALINAAYGVSAGVTLVDGNDTLWTCFPGGIAARLAIRHLSMFEEGERRGHGNAKSAIDYWKRKRREIVAEFSQAWVGEAQALLKQAGEAHQRLPVLKSASIDAARTYARVRSLSLLAPEASTILTVAASSVAHTLTIASRPGVNDHSYAPLVAMEQASADAFKDQRAFAFPGTKKSDRSHRSAAWASRRVALGTSRQHVVGQGVESVISTLSGLDVSSHSDKPLYYYCPMGARLEAVPGQVPFSVDLIGSRIVWLPWLQLVIASMVDALTESAVSGTDLPTISTFKLGAASQVTGLARHPLVISLLNSTVKVPLVDASEGAVSAAVAAPPADLVDAVERATKNLTIADFKQASIRVEHMRGIAYNAERLLFATSLARSTFASDGSSMRTELVVELQDEHEVISLAIALSMNYAETGDMPSSLVVKVPNLDNAQQVVAHAATRVSVAVSAGCKACALAEVALCL